jgi:hypothetical protein
MEQLPKNAMNDFVKSLFWALVLVCLFGVIVFVGLFWYYRPTIEWVR